MSKINTNDISVVVQGAIDKENTPKCLESIRKYLPHAEIILSTWEGSDIEGFDYDKVLLNQDPGGFKMSPFEVNNVKRQIFSTIQGLKLATRKYALKIRSDIALTGIGFIDYFDKFNTYNDDWHFFKKRVIVPSFISRDPRIWESPMCPSDWCSFGLIDDMIDLWDITIPIEEEKWFTYHKKNDCVKDYYYPLIARYNPEQFIWIGFLKKHVKSLHVDNMFDITPDSIRETLFSFANNLIILSCKQFGIKFLKQGRKGSDKWHIFTHNEFLKIYNEYSNGNAKIPLFDFERLGLYKYFWKSYKRLYYLAYKNKKRINFYRRELKFYYPYIYFLLKPLFEYLNYLKEDITILEQPQNIVKISIAIPVHDNFKYFKETLKSLKYQTFKDFEIIVSDDSSKLKNRIKIKKELLKFHNELGLNVKYIFTKKNLGQSRNTNQALNYVSGEWVRILHSDDIVHSSCLSDEVNIINENDNIIAIYHNIIPFRNSDSLNIFNSCNSSFEKLSPQFIIDNALHSHCAIPSSLLFNSELLNKIDMFNPRLNRACDWDFWSRIILFALKNNKDIIHFFEGRVFYRIHNNSNTNKINTKLLNYEEYEIISNCISKNLELNKYPSYKISNFIQASFAYRKKRLIADYKAISGGGKIYCLKRFIKYLMKI